MCGKITAENICYRRFTFHAIQGRLGNVAYHSSPSLHPLLAHPKQVIRKGAPRILLQNISHFFPYHRICSQLIIHLSSLQLLLLPLFGS